MLIDKYIKIHIVNSNAKHYRELGYQFKTPEDYIDIKISDLPNSSHVDVNVQCDYCNSKRVIKYRDYYKITKGLTSPYSCEKCKYEIIKQNYLNQYGVPSNLCLEETKEKIKTTCIKKYGTENPLSSKEVKEKIKQTNLKKYGCENPFSNEEIKKKIMNSIQKKYGVGHPSQNNQIMNKMKNTCFERYGTYNAMQNKEVNNKVRKTLYKNKSTPTSKQQLYLYSLYGGLLNYPLDWYNLDIYLENENIDIEYNGSGHDLQVKLGRLSQKQFLQKEIIRGNYIKSKNIKLFTIISRNDNLPSDEILLSMLQKARDLFNTTTCLWVEFDIDNSTIRNSQTPNGVFFNFGNLRKISNTDERRIS